MNRSKHALTVGVVTLLCATPVALYLIWPQIPVWLGVSMSEAEVVALVRDEGQPIVNALEAYRADHGVYPGDDLRLLVPDYLPTEPEVGWICWVDDGVIHLSRLPRFTPSKNASSSTAQPGSGGGSMPSWGRARR